MDVATKSWSLKGLSPLSFATTVKTVAYVLLFFFGASGMYQFSKMQPPVVQPELTSQNFATETLQRLNGDWDWLLSDAKMTTCFFGAIIALLTVAGVNITGGAMSTIKTSLAGGKIVIAFAWALKQFDDHQPTFIMIGLISCFLVCCWGWYHFSRHERSTSDLFAFFGTMIAAPLGSRALDTFLDERRKRKHQTPELGEIHAIKDALESIRAKIEQL